MSDLCPFPEITHSWHFSVAESFLENLKWFVMSWLIRDHHQTLRVNCDCWQGGPARESRKEEREAAAESSS